MKFLMFKVCQQTQNRFIRGIGFSRLLPLTNNRCVHSNQQQKDTSSTRKETVLVYEGPLRKRIKVVKFLSLSSSFTGFAVMPTVIYNMMGTSYILAGGFGLISTMFLATPLLLHYITKRYVLELNYDTKSELFTAKTFNLINLEKELTFKATDVTVPELPGLFTSFHAKNIPFFVDYRLIKDADVYEKMMGIDKSFGFGIQTDEHSEKKTTL